MCFVGIPHRGPLRRPPLGTRGALRGLCLGRRTQIQEENGEKGPDSLLFYEVNNKVNPDETNYPLRNYIITPRFLLFFRRFRGKTRPNPAVSPVVGGECA